MSNNIEKSPELKKPLSEDIEGEFFDTFINIIEALDNLTSSSKKHPELLQNITEIKKNFYAKLEEFKNSNYIPKGKINPESIEKLYEFQNLDWSIDENIEKIKGYLDSLRLSKLPRLWDSWRV